jgi:hypothetical protein
MVAMIDLFGLEQQAPRKNDRHEAAAITGRTCQTCIHRLDVTLWGCWLATGCRVGLVIRCQCNKHQSSPTVLTVKEQAE